MDKRAVGANYEEFVCQYLEGIGVQVIEKNYHIRQGEIDIIAKDGANLVFIEVKYRKNEKGGSPLEAVTFTKQKRICKTALHYMYSHGYSIEETPIRFDVAGVVGSELSYIKDAFEYIS